MSDGDGVSRHHKVSSKSHYVNIIYRATDSNALSHSQFISELEISTEGEVIVKMIMIIVNKFNVEVSIVNSNSLGDLVSTSHHRGPCSQLGHFSGFCEGLDIFGGFLEKLGH